MSRRPMGSAARTLPIVVSAMLLAGCLLDFKGFETGDTEPPALDMAPDLTQDQDLDAENNITSDTGDMEPDLPFNREVVVGAECDENSDCDGRESVCFDGYCTTGCSDDASCPPESFCAVFGNESFCTLPCSRNGCPGDREDLVCASVSPTAGFSAGACLPDSDGDGVIDRYDNCEMPNPTQADGDLDGVGDLCEDSPGTCPGDGVTELGPTDYDATTPATPDVAGTWFPVVGGLANGAPFKRLVIFDREDQMTRDGTISHPGHGFAAVQISPDEYLLTPGDRGTGGQFGRLLHVYRDGAVRVGAPFQPAVFDPVLARGGDGSIWMHAYVNPAGAGDAAWQLFRYDVENGRFVSMQSGVEPTPTQWWATTEPGGRVIFYSEISDPVAGTGRMIEVNPSGNIIDVGTSNFAAAAQPVRPFLTPAPGGGFFLWDRASGTAWAFRNRELVGEPMPELRVDLGTLTNPSWIAHPSGPGFTLVGHDPGDATMLRSRSYYLPCRPGLQSRDDDDMPDVVDLCPQGPGGALDEDLDGDWIGDPCDLDADGDGLPDNDVDPSLRDLDNDGETDDVDDDDDNDGIEDSADPRPRDTDQDGINNDVDVDDDNDGYRDTDEESPAAAVDPLQFNNSGRIAWVEGTQVFIAPLHDVENAQTVTRQGAGDPHLPRLSPDGQTVLLLDGAPGVATTVELASATTAQAVDLNVALWGIDPYQFDGGMVTEVIATHEGDDGGATTVVSSITLANPEPAPILSVLDGVGVPDVQSNVLVFAASPGDCDGCRSAYQMRLPNGVPTVIASHVSNPRMVRYNNGVVTLLGDGSDGQGTSAWFGSDGDYDEFRPPGARNVTAAVGFADGHLVISGTGPDGDEVWFWNGLTRRWHHLRDSNDSTSALDWAR